MKTQMNSWSCRTACHGEVGVAAFDHTVYHHLLGFDALCVFLRQMEGMEIYRAFADPSCREEVVASPLVSAFRAFVGPSCLREVVAAAVHPFHERSSEVGLFGEELEVHSSPCAVAIAGDDAALALRSLIQIVLGTKIPKLCSVEVQIVHAVTGSSSNSDSLYPPPVAESQDVLS